MAGGVTPAGVAGIFGLIEEATVEVEAVEAEVAPGQVGDLSATRGALDEALLDEERLVDLLHRAGVFAKGGGDGRQADRAAAELGDDRGQYLVVDFVEPVAVDVEGLEGVAGDFGVYGRSEERRVGKECRL